MAGNGGCALLSLSLIYSLSPTYVLSFFLSCSDNSFSGSLSRPLFHSHLLAVSLFLFHSSPHLLPVLFCPSLSSFRYFAHLLLFLQISCSPYFPHMYSLPLSLSLSLSPSLPPPHLPPNMLGSHMCSTPSKPHAGWKLNLVCKPRAPLTGVTVQPLS